MEFQYSFSLHPLRFFVETKSVKSNVHLEHFLTTRSNRFDKASGAHKEDLQVFYIKPAHYMSSISSELDKLGGHFEIGLID